MGPLAAPHHTGGPHVIVGVGIDVVDVGRFIATLDRAPGLRLRLFTPRERDLPAQSLAARFAAKEAVIKALTIVDAPTPLTEIEIVGAGGVPRIELTGSVGRLAEQRGWNGASVSLSHTATQAMAMVAGFVTDPPSDAVPT